MRGEKLVIAVVVGLVLVSVAQADIIIDSFDVSQRLDANSGTPVAEGSVTGAGIIGIGGERDSRASYDSAPNEVVLEANAGSNSLPNFSIGADTRGGADVVWDGVDGSSTINFTGLGGIDLTDGGALDRIAVKVAFDDLAVDVILEVYTNSSSSSTATINLPGGIFAPQTHEVLFSSFSTLGTGPADFTNVGAIVLKIDDKFAATDLQLDFIKATPEPATLGLLGLGLPLLRKRRR